MITRPKISRNEWKTTEIGAFQVGNFAPFSCTVADGLAVALDDAVAVQQAVEVVLELGVGRVEGPLRVPRPREGDLDLLAAPGQGKG